MEMKSALMETMDIFVMNLDLNTFYTPLIIPTVLIPFTLISVGISVVATFIAGLFGIELKMEGPKQLLEVLLKPKFLISAVILNLIFLGGFQAYQYIKNLPSFEFTINRLHEVTPNNKTYVDLNQKNNIHYETLADSPKKIKLELSWETTLPMGAFRSGALSSNSLFLGTDDGYVYELDSKSGKTIRRFYIGTIVTPSPIIHKNNLYSGEGSHDTHHARIYKVDLVTGKHIGSYETKGHTEGQPVIAMYGDTTLLMAVAGVDGLHAIDPKSMKKVWTVNPGHIDASVRSENGVVYVGTGREKGDSKKYQTYALAYDLKSGKEIWRNEIPMSSWMEPALTKKYACFIMGEIYFKTNMGGISCFNKITGEPEFSILNDAPLIGIPLVLGNDIIISDFSGKICRINTEARRRSWCLKTETKGKQMTSASYDKHRNLIVYTTADRGAYFLNPTTGEIVFHFNPEEPKWGRTYASATITDDGVIFVDIVGSVRRYKIISQE
jgi:outer membrane protein assembly factor BamB